MHEEQREGAGQGVDLSSTLRVLRKLRMGLKASGSRSIKSCRGREGESSKDTGASTANLRLQFHPSVREYDRSSNCRDHKR